MPLVPSYGLHLTAQCRVTLTTAPPQLHHSAQDFFLRLGVILLGFSGWWILQIVAIIIASPALLSVLLSDFCVSLQCGMPCATTTYC
jgi:hypothetical protein